MHGNQVVLLNAEVGSRPGEVGLTMFGMTMTAEIRAGMVLQGITENQTKHVGREKTESCEEMMIGIERKKESNDVRMNDQNGMSRVALGVPRLVASVFFPQFVGSPLWMTENETGTETIVKVGVVVMILVA